MVKTGTEALVATQRSVINYPEDIKNQVQKIVDQADVIVGYNIDFDINFLEKCMGIDFSNKIIADPGDY